MILAVIPARGGSKGIPRKNVVHLCGRPLISYSIEQAHRSQLVNRVVVATDDEEIAAVAKHHGADIYWRSADSATDTAPTEVVLREVIRAQQQTPDLVVFLQATSPIRQPYDVDEAIATLTASDADSLFSARVVHGYTWRRSGRIISPNYACRTPRQGQSTHTLEENGSLYVFKPWVLEQLNNRLGGTIVPYLMHPLDSFQIDEQDDLQLMAELMEVRLNVRHAAEV